MYTSPCYVCILFFYCWNKTLLKVFNPFISSRILKTQKFKGLKATWNKQLLQAFILHFGILHRASRDHCDCGHCSLVVSYQYCDASQMHLIGMLRIHQDEMNIIRFIYNFGPSKDCGFYHWYDYLLFNVGLHAVTFEKVSYQLAVLTPLVWFRFLTGIYWSL